MSMSKQIEDTNPPVSYSIGSSIALLRLKMLALKDSVVSPIAHRVGKLKVVSELFKSRPPRTEGVTLVLDRDGNIVRVGCNSEAAKQAIELFNNNKGYFANLIKESKDRQFYKGVRYNNRMPK